MIEKIKVVFEYLKHIFNVALTICIAFVVIFALNFSFCDAEKINRNTKELERETDSTSNPKRFERIKQRNGLQHKSLQRAVNFPNPIPIDSNLLNL